MTDSAQPELNQWERKTLEKVLMEAIYEQRRSRRWKIFFRLLFLFFIIAVIAMFAVGAPTSGVLKPHTAVINIEGMIMDKSKASADNINKGLTRAFEDKLVRGIILNINSPGGSAVQSNEVFDHIMAMKKEHAHIKVYAVCNDSCASGAYYIAAAADEIYANKASIVGSIGVRLSGFGFVQAMEKVGVTRRFLASGDEKDFLDPFQPMREEDVKHAETMLDIIHQQFIDSVKAGRGDKLKDTPKLFSGIVWTGEQAKQIGLIDDFGTTVYVAKEVIKEDNMVDYTYNGGLLQALNENMATSISQQLMSKLSMNAGIEY